MTTTNPQKRGPKGLPAGTQKQRVVIYLRPALIKWLTDAAERQGRGALGEQIEKLLTQAQTNNK